VERKTRRRFLHDKTTSDDLRQNLMYEGSEDEKNDGL
jgi:hypothetical protein